MFNKKSLEFIQQFKEVNFLDNKIPIWNDENKQLDLLNNCKKDIRWDIKILQEVSYNCFGQCPYCMNRGLNYNVPELPVERFIDFYKLFIENGHKIFELRLTGGEPLQPNVIERTKKLMNYAIFEPNIHKLQLNTNGFWPIPEEWSNHEKIIIQFSLDGNKNQTNKNYGNDNLYDNLIKHCDFCIANNINFQFRCVINNENDINDITELSNYYKKQAIISWPCPVGNLTSLCKEDYISHILKTEQYEKYFRDNNYYPHMRKIVCYCDQTMLPNYLNFMITPNGQIGTCAYLANIIKTQYTIDNFPFDDIFSFRENLRLAQKDITCDFPQGFLTFWENLSEEEKKQINNYINEPHRAMIMPSIKEFYKL